MVLEVVDILVRQYIDDEENIKFLKDFIDKCFRHELFGKIVIFYGNGHGKTSFVNNIISLLGEENCLKINSDFIEKFIEYKTILLIVDDDKYLNFEYLMEKIKKINIIICINSTIKYNNIKEDIKEDIKIINLEKKFEKSNAFDINKFTLKHIINELYFLKKEREILQEKVEYFQKIIKEKNI